MKALTIAFPSLKSLMSRNDFGQLGRDVYARADSAAVEVLENVASGSAGLFHTVLVQTNGTVYSFGKGDGGRLGNGTESDIGYPHPSFHIESNIRSLSCGSTHNALVTENGELYSWGFDSFGQTGCYGEVQFEEPRRVVLRPRQVLVSNQPNTVFTQVSCGAYHTLALDERGRVYSFGRTDFGRCGVIPKRKTAIKSLEESFQLPLYTPYCLTEIQDVKHVVAGGFFSLVWTHENELFSFGGNEFGELGNGTVSKFEVFPQRVRLDSAAQQQPIVQVSCGGFHTALLTKQGRVFSFGSNQKKQLGNESCLSPFSNLAVEMDALQQEVVTQISCGPHYTLALTRDNTQLWYIGNMAGKPSAAELLYQSTTRLHLPQGQGTHHALILEEVK